MTVLQLYQSFHVSNVFRFQCEGIIDPVLRDIHQLSA